MKKLLVLAIVISIVPLGAMEEPKKGDQPVKQEEKPQQPLKKRMSDKARNEALRILERIR